MNHPRLTNWFRPQNFFYFIKNSDLMNIRVISEQLIGLVLSDSLNPAITVFQKMLLAIIEYKF